ncbi:MAG: N-acetyl-gamma-glutamyl-phosphate reductase, partial [Pseudomonadota bacterium]
MDSGTKSLGIIGARGYVGRELLRLLAGHGGFRVTAVSSRQHAGKAVHDTMPEAPPGLTFEALTPEDA